MVEIKSICFPFAKLCLLKLMQFYYSILTHNEAMVAGDQLLKNANAFLQVLFIWIIQDLHCTHPNKLKTT